MKKIEWLKTLSEKAIYGKARYLTMLVPYVGDYVAFNFAKSKDLKIAIALADGTGRVASLAATAITGNLAFLYPYAGLTIGEGVGSNVPKIDEYFSERNRKKRIECDLQDMIKNEKNIQ